MIRTYENYLLSKGRAAGTVSQRLAHIEQLQLWHPDLLAVTTADLEARLAAMHVAGLFPETRKSVRASYRIFYRWAARTGRISDDPAAELEPIRVPERIARIAPDDVVQFSLIGAPLRERGMILLARLACLRLSEFASLQPSAREHDSIRIKGKGEKERMVYVNDDLMPTLLALEAENGSDYYFPGRWGGHIHPAAANKIVTRVTGCNPHSLRHAGATAAYRATGDLRAVQLMLGHASMATTQRYLHVNELALRNVARGTSFVAPISMVGRRGFTRFPSDEPLAA